MRTFLVLLVGIGLGVFGVYLYQAEPSFTARRHAVEKSTATDTREAAQDFAARGRALAGNVSDAVAGKMREWHLTGSDIHAELAKSGEIVRENAARAKERVEDVRITAVIKAKYVLDRDLSARAIAVESRNGAVTLRGTVPSESLVGRAVADALDTEGVHRVTAHLAVAGE